MPSGRWPVRSIASTVTTLRFSLAAASRERSAAGAGVFVGIMHVEQDAVRFDKRQILADLFGDSLVSGFTTSGLISVTRSSTGPKAPLTTG